MRRSFTTFLATCLATCLAPGGLIVGALLSACASAPAENFYALTAEAPPATARDASGPSVSVGAVNLAEIFDRPQLVIQIADHRVLILEQQRWAQPLASEIQRVMALNLARQLDTSFDPERRSAATGRAMDAVIRVALDVQRFDSIVGKDVNIELRWTVRTGDDEPRSGRSVATEPVAAPGYDAIVAAHSRALARISREIAGAVMRARNKGN